MSIIDFHNHLVPGVDDGAQTEVEAAAALRAFRADDVRGAIVTPHINASMAAVPTELAARLAAITAGWEILRRCAAEVSIEVWRGAEVALDIPWTDFSDARLRLNGTRFVLVEFAFMRIPPGSAQVLARLCEAGWQPVLAHPERYRSAAPIPELAVDWRAAGALLQLNGASLLKRYGDRPERIAGELLRAGLVDYVCSDYHARGRPRVAEYRALLEEQAGHEAAVVLTETNPQRLLADQAPLPIPLAPQSVAWRNRWRRFFR